MFLFPSSTNPQQVLRSLRFRNNNSTGTCTYLQRTLTAPNRRTFTFSMWVRRGSDMNEDWNSGRLITGLNNGTDSSFRFNGNAGNDLDTLHIYFNNAAYSFFAGTPTTNIMRKFRDNTGWYHLVCAVDTTQATDTNRVKMWVNGVRAGVGFAAYPTLNLETDMLANNGIMYVGYSSYFEAFDGYMAEFYYLDGIAATGSDFGMTDPLTNEWVPKRYNGSFGTEGFYLPFTDGTSTTTLGYDKSGNGKNATLTNFSLTDGPTYDWVRESPTNRAEYNSGTAKDTNGYGRYNYLSNDNYGASYVYDAGLTAVFPEATGVISLYPIPDGLKTYFEVTVASRGNATNQGPFMGLVKYTNQASMSAGVNGMGTLGALNSDKWLVLDSAGSFINTSIAYSNNQVVSFAVDFSTSNGRIYTAVNNTYVNSTGANTGSPNTGANATISSIAVQGTGDVGSYFEKYYLYIRGAGGGSGNNTVYVNFGQRPFAYVPPTGYNAHNTTTILEPVIERPKRFFDVINYTGTGATLSIANLEFQPSILLIKRLDSSGGHNIHDVVRGSTNQLQLSSSGAQVTNATSVTSFDANGFTLSTGAAYNASGGTYVAYAWNTPSTTTSAVALNSNIANCANVTYSANLVSRVTVSAFKTTAEANATVTNLINNGQYATNPGLILGKNYDQGNGWVVYHGASGSYTPGNTNSYYNLLRIDSTNALSTPNTTTWDTGSISSIGVKTNSATNWNTTSNNHILYYFGQRKGFCEVGRYVGTGSKKGQLIYTGFKPKMLIIKNASAAGAWWVYNSVVNGGNPLSYATAASNGAAQTTGLTEVDFYASGFRLANTNADHNASGNTYLYVAFADIPFNYATAGG